MAHLSFFVLSCVSVFLVEHLLRNDVGFVTENHFSLMCDIRLTHRRGSGKTRVQFHGNRKSCKKMIQSRNFHCIFYFFLSRVPEQTHNKHCIELKSAIKISPLLEYFLLNAFHNKASTAAATCLMC